VNRLTPAERTAFTNAVVQLKNNGDYDTFINQHAGAMQHGHNGPAFFPWHREFILRFEQALQAIDSSVNLPYWDWTVDNLNSAGTESLIWRDDCMGGPGNPGQNFRVTTGPFAAWNLRRSNFNIFSSPGGGGSITSLMSNPDYNVFRGVEGPHGSAHVWVGGDMGSVATAVRDPVFFLLHCNVDRLWSEWIRQHQGTAGFQPYKPPSGAATGHNLNDSMWPWNGTTNPFGVPPWTVAPEIRRPADQLDHRALGYFYDTIDNECRLSIRPKTAAGKEILKDIVKEKELIKDRLPKELIAKERLPKELVIDKPVLKDRSPKEIKEIREFDPGRPFIRPEARPDLTLNALNFEGDVTEAELDELRAVLGARR
jgi:hypothetical protein